MADSVPHPAADIAAAFAASLAEHAPLFDHRVQRREGLLRARGYAAALDVPEVLVSAVRAVVFRGSRVIVVGEADGTSHVMPGGRREAGEGLEATVRRELLEECGWRVGALRPFGLLHFQHTEPPPGWRDMVNLIFVTEADRYDRAALDPSQGKVRSRLMSVKAATGMLADRHRAVLQAAVRAR